MTNDDNNEKKQGKEGGEEENKKTGIDFFDNLNPEDRSLAIDNAKRHWQSLAPQQRAEHLSELYSMIREKLKQHKGMISSADAIKQFLNEDFQRRSRRQLKKQSKWKTRHCR